MGNFFSDYQPEDEERQPRRQHHHSQQKNIPESQGQKQHRPISSLSTSELLDYLERQFEQTLSTIRKMKTDKWFNNKGKRYVCSQMIEKENLLHWLNSEMQHFSGMKTAAGEKIRRLQGEIKTLEKENKRLINNNTYLDDLITKPTTEANERSNQQPGQYGNNKENKKKGQQMKGSGNPEQERIKELQQQLDAYVRNTEKERKGRADAISYAEQLKKELQTLTARNADLTEKVNVLSEEKNALLSRLSKMAGDKLVQNNPAIADLSDQNRPTKLGEVYSEIYDNEWTDAYEGLTAGGYEEQDAIMTLRLTLLNIFQFCSKKSELLLKKTEDAVNILFEEYKETKEKNNLRHLTMPRNIAEQWGKIVRRSSFDDNFEVIALQERWKPMPGHTVSSRDQSFVKVVKSEEAIHNQLKIFRKEVSESMVPIVEKAYIAASWNDRECIHILKPFIKKCILLTWMMVVQSPPMTLAKTEPGEKFDKNVYKEYTKTGNKVSYVVWPALHLNHDGPVVGKGVAQATHN